tara:strand:+ start:81 stop:380 length:300 start_codon:yes stop_codon:yes gene_type:complete
MFTTSLVEKEVEVTVKKLREVTMYEWNDTSYTREDFENTLRCLIWSAGSRTLKELGSDYRCLTKIRDILSCIPSDSFIELYKSIKEYMEMYEQVQEHEG